MIHILVKGFGCCVQSQSGFPQSQSKHGSSTETGCSYASILVWNRSSIYWWVPWLSLSLPHASLLGQHHHLVKWAKVCPPRKVLSALHYPEALHVIGWRECAAFANTNKADGQTLRPLPFPKGILGCRDSPTPVLTAIELLLSSFRLLSLSSSWAPQSSEVTEIIDPRKDNEILGKDFRALPKLQCFQLLEPKRLHRENGCLPV